jgi:hypothetical protein
VRTSSKILLAAAVVTALVPLWGYWYSIRHAALQLRVDDYALKSPTQLYGTPHEVSLVLRDESNAQLAVAKSVEPLGYILAVHPDAAIGNCEHRKDDYTACYEQYSAWSAAWAPLVRRADVTVGSCAVKGRGPTLEQRVAGLVGAASPCRRPAASVLRVRDVCGQPGVRRSHEGTMKFCRCRAISSPAARP